MAVIKCKMCGGDLQIVEGNSVCECEYCGSKQTVPIADNEKKMTLFARANRLLRNCEFDKASGVFESIVAEFPEEAESKAHKYLSLFRQLVSEEMIVEGQHKAIMNTKKERTSYDEKV